MYDSDGSIDDDEGEFGESLNGIPFVGRENVKSDIKTQLVKKHVRIIQICGPPMVGKSRLANQVCLELEREAGKTKTPLKTHVVDVTHGNTLEIIINQLSMVFDLDAFSTNKFYSEFERYLGTDCKTRHILHLDACERIPFDSDLHDEFLSLLKLLVTPAKGRKSRIQILLSSRTKLMFPRLGANLQAIKEIGLLSPCDANTLLKCVAPSIDLCEHGDTLTRYCFYYPLPIIIAGRILQDRGSLLKPSELCEILENDVFGGLGPETASSADNPAHVIRTFIEPLEQHLKKYFAIYSYFPGSFSADAAACLGGQTKVSEAKQVALTRLYDRSIVDFNQSSERFLIHEMLRLYASKHLTHLTEIDMVRFKFATYFGTKLNDIGKLLETKTSRVVFQNLEHDWPNVQHLLREAIHCQEDTYHVYIKVIEQADDFLLRFMPKNTIEFLESCLNAAAEFGTEYEKSVILSTLGCSISNSAGSLKEVIRKYKQAYPELAKTGHTHQHQKLLMQMGWNYYLRGKIAKADDCHRKALTLVPNDVSEQKSVNNLLTIKNRIALAHIFRNETEAAKMVLDEAINDAEERSPNNTIIPVMYNSKGLLYQRGDKDIDKAEVSFEKSLAARREFQDIDSPTLVVPLNNVAGVKSIKGDYEGAIERLTEALEIRKKAEWVHHSTALTLWHLGRNKAKLSQYDEALSLLLEAKRIYEIVTPKHFCIAQVKHSIAETYAKSGCTYRAKAGYIDNLDTRHHWYEDLVDDKIDVILSSYRSVLELSDDDEEWSYYAEEYEDELNKLIDSYPNDVAKVTQFRNFLMDLKWQRYQRVKQQEMELMNISEDMGKICISAVSSDDNTKW